MSVRVAVGLYAELLAQRVEDAQWLADALQNMNAVLSENGILTYDEPRQKIECQSRSSGDSFSYSTLHYLRRYYACAVSNRGWKPQRLEVNESPANDLIVEQESMKLESHLLCHSYCDGFYLPIKFSEIVVDQQGRIPGGMLCSSYQLMDELVFVAAKLRIHLDDGSLTDHEADRVNMVAGSETDFCREHGVWIVLYEAARLSILYKTAICFC